MIISEKTFEVLRTTSLFAGFTDEQLEVVPKVGRPREFDAGEKIVEQGATGTQSLWLVLEGEVNVVVGDQVHGTIGPGNHFGELALLTDAPRSADVVAQTAGLALEFSRRHLEGLIAANPQVAMGMLAELATRLRQTTEALADVIASSAEAADEATRLGLQKAAGQKTPDLGAIEYALLRLGD